MAYMYLLGNQKEHSFFSDINLEPIQLLTVATSAQQKISVQVGVLCSQLHELNNIGICARKSDVTPKSTAMGTTVQGYTETSRKVKKRIVPPQSEVGNMKQQKAGQGLWEPRPEKQNSSSSQATLAKAKIPRPLSFTLICGNLHTASFVRPLAEDRLGRLAQAAHQKHISLVCEKLEEQANQAPRMIIKKTSLVKGDPESQQSIAFRCSNVAQNDTNQWERPKETNNTPYANFSACQLAGLGASSRC